MIRETANALVACVATFILCAVAYPAVVWGLAQLAFPHEAEGSLIYDRDRTVIGSELIAQPFTSDKYFFPRPSAVDYKADATGGSNLGTKNPDLKKKIAERAEALKATEKNPVPVDLVTASGGGMDPDISPECRVLPGVPRGHRSRYVGRAGQGPDRAAHRAIGCDHRGPGTGQCAQAQPRAGRGETGVGGGGGLTADYPSENASAGDKTMPTETNRPSPEQFLNLIRRQERGRLKVYLGSSAGVGKTYAMLREGHRLKQQGVDVVIGFVETHGRAETAEQIGDLEVIPPRHIEYRGVTLREMDLDAILARRPTVCLVDELAHTNAPAAGYPSATRTSRSCSALAST